MKFVWETEAVPLYKEQSEHCNHNGLEVYCIPICFVVWLCFLVCFSINSSIDNELERHKCMFIFKK